MAHKTLIGGTAYEVSGGKTLVDGAAYSIKNGKTLVGGTAYEVGFGLDFVPVYNFGTLTTQNFFGLNRHIINCDTLPFDLSKCNAYMVDGVIYGAVYGETSNSSYYSYCLNDEGTNKSSTTESNPVSIVVSCSKSDGKSTINIYFWTEGTHDLKIGTV